MPGPLTGIGNDGIEFTSRLNKSRLPMDPLAQADKPTKSSDNYKISVHAVAST